MTLCSVIQPPRWNALKIRYNVFMTMPRTETEAIAGGFEKVSECEDNIKFKGKQYMKDNDPIPTLLFDKNGYIAGIQAGIPKDLPGNYPKPELQPLFLDDGELFKVTAYFVDPLFICKKGRSEQQFRLQGTGTDLFLQNGDNPEKDLIEGAQEESKTTWRQGKCKAKMGFHYFLDVTEDMSCDVFPPIYLLFYEGNLKGFVFSFNAVLNSTVVALERPSPLALGNMLEGIPPCMNLIQRSTLHIYFENNPESYTCGGDQTCVGNGVSSTWIAILLPMFLAITLII